nr:amino acid ABC transporter ATP-binding protein [uncultured Cupriavidus sp.]
MNDVAVSRPMIQVQKVSKWFGELRVLDEISFDVREGEVVVMVGPSGSGKSTLLRCINFLEEFQQGCIHVDGEPVGYRKAAEDGKRIRQSEADISRLRMTAGMVFQNYNLFPHRTALDNVMMGPLMFHQRGKAEIRDECMALLEKVGLADKASAYPARLSGGQQQRIAIARSLAMHPKVILFDEVTSALDPELVDEVLRTIRDLSKEGMTMIIVTHEMQFARDVADRLLFFYQGKILEDGNPREIFANPTTERFKAFVRRFSQGHLAAA